MSEQLSSILVPKLTVPGTGTKSERVLKALFSYYIYAKKYLNFTILFTEWKEDTGSKTSERFCGETPVIVVLCRGKDGVLC